jgi:glycosyltransferase involved in cell wall biosynthesis
LMGDKVEAGLSVAKGTWACVVDDDDRLHDEYIDRVLAALRSDIDAVGYRIGLYNKGLYQGRFDHYHGGSLPGPSWGSGRAICPKNVWRTEFGRAIGFGNHYSADQDWTIAMATLIRTATEIPATLYRYEQSPGYTFGGVREATMQDYDSRSFRWVTLP